MCQREEEGRGKEEIKKKGKERMNETCKLALPNIVR